MSDVIVSTTNPVTSVTTIDDVTTIDITEQSVVVSTSTAGFQGVPGANSDPTYVFVTNRTGVQLNKGAIVYVSGANGVHTQVSLAQATGDVTSARTLGWLSEDIANNATGLCMVEGYLDGVDTQGVTEGAQLYLSPTVAGGFTETKPSAPDHMVYVGVCAKASAGNGRVFVKVQNGYELDELHNVKIVAVANGDVIRYNSVTSLWENVASTALTVGSAVVSGTATYAVTSGTATYATNAGTSVYATNAGTSVYSTTSGTAVFATNASTATALSGSITRSQVTDFTSGTVASAGTAQQAGTAIFATNASTAVSLSGSITVSQVSDFASGTVASASVSGTASFATTAGTATTISGTITRSQVSDFASGTVAVATNASTATYADTSGTSVFATNASTATTISGTITRSQVTDFTSGTVAQATNAGTASYLDTSLGINLTGSTAAIVIAGTAGTSGQVLTSAGAGATPTWTTPSSSGTNYINIPWTGFKSGHYYFSQGLGTTNATPTLNGMTLVPFSLSTSTTFTKISVYVNVLNASGLVRLGIYNTGSDGLPSSRLLDAGTVDTTSTGVRTITINQTLSAGNYWLAAAPQTATTAMTCKTSSGHLPGVSFTTNPGNASITGYVVSSVSGALPNPVGTIARSTTPIEVYLQL